MAIFPHIILEDIVQVNDKTRINCTKSYVTKDEAAITLVEIEPESGAGFVDVTGSKNLDWFLDYQFATDGVKTVSCRITTDGVPVTFTKEIEVITEADDKLFSNDFGLVKHKSDIMKYLPEGKNSYLYLHRRAQEMIVRWVDDMGYRDDNGDKLTKDAFVDITEVSEWSIFTVLALIMDDLSNSVGDNFNLEYLKFKEKARMASDRAVLRLDLNGDGNISDGEAINMSSVRIVRR
jgi:hypothetical protein